MKVSDLMTLVQIIYQITYFNFKKLKVDNLK